MDKHYRHFKLSEFACRCCGENKISPLLVEKLDTARAIAKTPFVITSGYRCPKHNEAVGGVSNSKHLEGLAADILTSDSKARYKILSSLLAAGFTSMILYKHFIHVEYSEARKVVVG